MRTHRGEREYGQSKSDLEGKVGPAEGDGVSVGKETTRGLAVGRLVGQAAVVVDAEKEATASAEAAWRPTHPTPRPSEPSWDEVRRRVHLSRRIRRVHDHHGPCIVGVPGGGCEAAENVGTDAHEDEGRPFVVAERVEGPAPGEQGEEERGDT